jgi:RIO-like serine/threonine protein kinase
MDYEIIKFLGKGDYSPVFEIKKAESHQASKFYLGYPGDDYKVQNAEREFGFLKTLGDLETIPTAYNLNIINKPFLDFFREYDPFEITPVIYQDNPEKVEIFASIDMELINGVSIWEYKRNLPDEFFERLESAVDIAYEREVVMPGDMSNNVLVSNEKTPYIIDLELCSWRYELKPNILERRILENQNTLNIMRKFKQL